MYGKLTLGSDNSVFLTYEQIPGNSGFYAQKEIYLVGYKIDGTPIGIPVQLMSAQTFQITYLHHAVPDGNGGGYVYIWHSGIGGAFNTYVFHYDQDCNSTISNLNGTPVHSDDPANFYLDAYGSVDPISRDLIIAYRQTDAVYQNQSRIYVNRITPTVDRVWNDGVLVAENVGSYYSDIKVDAFDDGSGFSVIYAKSSESNSYLSTIEAVGMDMEGNILWTKTLSSEPYSRTISDNSTGFHNKQNIIAWIDSVDNVLYAQNIGTDGTMGQIEGTNIEEQVNNNQIVTINRVYNISGQSIRHNNLNELNNGIYILQGVAENGRLVSRKVIVMK